MTMLYHEELSAGAIIEGRWNHNQYRVERLLGRGANGQVYLVSRGKSLYALKIGLDVAEFQSEVNVLQSIKKKSVIFRDYFIEADDLVRQEEVFPFYVMKYVKGLSPDEYILHNGLDWSMFIGLNLLRKLKELHRHGWVFGDLKLDNMIVNNYGKVELVDFGGVTVKGNSIKQFTEIYDRGFWNAGSRTADDNYDLFSFAVLYILMVYNKDTRLDVSMVLPQNRHIELLLAQIKHNPYLEKPAPLLKKALLGKYRDSNEAYEEWKMMCYTNQPESVHQGTPGWLKVGFAASLILFAITVIIFGM